MDFKIMNISFCGSTADNIVTKESKAFILDILKDKYSVSIQDKQALILTDKSIKYIQLNPHLITIKTGGSNYYLFMSLPIIYGRKLCQLSSQVLMRIRHSFNY